MRKLSVFSLMVVLAMLAAACSPAATQAPAQPTAASAASAAAPTTAAVPTTAAAAPTAASAAPTTAAPAPTAGVSAPVVQLPAGAVVQKNHLLICTDFPYPPQEFFDENGDPKGLDVDMGTEIANRMGLKVQFVNSVFDTIIAAVTSGKCDIIISAQNITADRQKQVSMIPYFQAGQSFVSVKGNPNKINTAQDLCGKPVAAESGTTEADYLQSSGDYKGKGLAVECTSAGKEAPKTVVTQKDTDALQQLQAGKVVAYATDSPVAAYYALQHPDQFEVVGKLVEPVKEGISVPCGQKDCTNAPLSPLGQAVQTALKSMMADGTYAKILKNWNLSDGAVSQ
jgi:polar amino acid transport system substrate-binding protein